MRNKFKALLWDNDGVLVDTETIFMKASINAFNTFGIVLSKHQWIDLFLVKGLRTSQIAKAFGLDDHSAKELIALRDAEYVGELDKNVLLRPHIAECLTALPENIINVMVTGSSRLMVTTMHRSTGILDTFTHIITAEDYCLPKPAPDAYIEALGRIKLPRAFCLAIEDSPKGVKAATCAGLSCVALMTDLTCDLNFSSPSLTVSDPMEILEMIYG